MSVLDIRRTLVFPYAVDRVWHALTDPDAMAQWLMPNDFAPRVGHAFTLRMDARPGWNGRVQCVVLEVDPPRKLVYSWRGREAQAAPTTVTYHLEPAPRGTRLRLEHSGFEGVGGVVDSLILRLGVRRHYRDGLGAVLDRLEGSAPAAPEG